MALIFLKLASQNENFLRQSQMCSSNEKLILSISDLHPARDPSLGVDLVSLRQNIDTTLPAGRLTLQILGAVAEFERELLRERVKAGMAQARRSGKHVGRPALRKFRPSDIDQMKQLRSEGTSVRKLATDFGTSQWMVARLINKSPAPSDFGSVER